MSFEADDEGELDCRYTSLSNPEDVRALVAAISVARRSISCCFCRRNGSSTIQVRALYLHGCGITAGGAEVLAQFLQSAGASALTHLSLSDNPIGDPGVLALIHKGLMNNNSLEYLSLRSTGITSECGPTIGKLLEASTLTEISLEGNALEDKGVCTMFFCAHSTLLPTHPGSSISSLSKQNKTLLSASPPPSTPLLNK